MLSQAVAGITHFEHHCGSAKTYDIWKVRSQIKKSLYQLEKKEEFSSASWHNVHTMVYFQTNLILNGALLEETPSLLIPLSSPNYVDEIHCPSSYSQQATLHNINTRQWRSPLCIAPAVRFINRSDKSNFNPRNKKKGLSSVNTCRSQQNLIWLWVVCSSSGSGSTELASSEQLHCPAFPTQHTRLSRNDIVFF